MRAEELMVGDWVCTENDSTPRQVDWIRTGEVGLLWNKVATPSYLVPIPITPEILKKNRFKSWEHGYIFKERIGIGGQTTSATSPIEIIIYEGGHSVIMNPHEGKDFQGSIDNVHELQHALRLCGIEKEIVV